MSALRHPLWSLLLLVFWLGATQHCALEASGLLEIVSSHSQDSAIASAPATEPTGCCATDAQGCSDDGCDEVENSLFRLDGESVKLVAPDLASCLLFLCAPLVSPPAESAAPQLVSASLHAAPAWVPAWQFERRAAAPAHAPDVVIA